MECNICNKEYTSVAAYVQHFVLHSQSINRTFNCGIKHCSRIFATVAALRSHILREHPRRDTYSVNTRSTVIDCDTNLTCKVLGCGLRLENTTKLLSHLRDHIEDGDAVCCPFLECSRTFCNKNSLNSHLFRDHRKRHADSETPNDVDATPNDGALIGDKARVTETGNEDCDTSLLATIDAHLDEPKYIQALAQFYLKLQCVYLVPCSTIDLIIQDLQNLTTYANTFRCKQVLGNFQLTEDVRECLLNELSNINLFYAARHGPLRTDYLRKRWCRTRMKYVAPVAYIAGSLVNNKNKPKCFYYVPIKQSLAALLSDLSVARDYRDTIAQQNGSRTDELTDIVDGSVYKNCVLFSSNSGSLGLILYCDSFEVANPLGSARNKHKVMAIYYSLVNIRPHNRSGINHMQLVLLANDKDFNLCGQDIVLAPLVTDLKSLETEGIQVCIPGQGEMVLKGTVVAVTGDNLGSHTLAGFTKNFSTAQHFCRYCTITRTEFREEVCSLGECRTPDTYLDSIATQFLDGTPVVNGIQFDSIFNSLLYFKACLPGFPPCLAHDIFEGVAAYDMILCIKHFVKVRKWFTYEELNGKISKFKYKEGEGNNTPCTVKATSEKLQGTASQNWCFIRLFPLIIGQKIADYDDAAWILILLLREIVELVCSPKITCANIAYLDSLTEEYLSLRSETFAVPLKPKHHYMRHYGQLTLRFGPLIRLWTLRFESKHSYFKKVVRSQKNFKNMCHSLAENHQLLQCLLSDGNLLKEDVYVEDSITFAFELYNASVQCAVKEFGLDSANSVACEELKLRGTTYKKGQFVIISKHDFDIAVGEIKLLILKNDTQVFFVVCKMPLEHLPHLHTYKQISLCNSETLCIPKTGLLDYHPLAAYPDNDHRLNFVLKHFV